MIIGGALGIIFSIVAIASVAALSSLVEINAGLLYFSCILTLISGIVELIAGIIGVKNYNNPEKATTCIVWGAIVAVLSVLGNILTVAGGGSFSASSLVTGLVLPVIFIIGAVMNKKA